MAPATDLGRRYDGRFYDDIRDGCRLSAETVIPAIGHRLGTVRSVVDVGCGEGWWGAQFKAVRVQGFDGGIAPNRQIPVTECNLTQPIPTSDWFDLAICLEVAEHLPEASAGHLVSELVRLSDTVLFSAAMPRQGGSGHVNCQPPAYWADLFAEHDYVCDGSLRFEVWDDPAVEPWYKSNLLLFMRRSAALLYDYGEQILGPVHVIHPDLWLEPR